MAHHNDAVLALEYWEKEREKGLEKVRYASWMVGTLRRNIARSTVDFFDLADLPNEAVGGK